MVLCGCLIMLWEYCIVLYCIVRQWRRIDFIFLKVFFLIPFFLDSNVLSFFIHKTRSKLKHYLPHVTPLDMFAFIWKPLMILQLPPSSSPETHSFLVPFSSLSSPLSILILHQNNYSYSLPSPFSPQHQHRRMWKIF